MGKDLHQHALHRPRYRRATLRIGLLLQLRPRRPLPRSPPEGRRGTRKIRSGQCRGGPIRPVFPSQMALPIQTSPQRSLRMQGRLPMPMSPVAKSLAYPDLAPCMTHPCPAGTDPIHFDLSEIRHRRLILFPRRSASAHHMLPVVARRHIFPVRRSAGRQVGGTRPRCQT